MPSLPAVSVTVFNVIHQLEAKFFFHFHSGQVVTGMALTLNCLCLAASYLESQASVNAWE